MKLKYIYWKDGNEYLGYLEQYPDYMTQGISLDELIENLKDVYIDLESGYIPAVRNAGELEIA
jgi:predicted RNase H-like HicB family nuclease